MKRPCCVEDPLGLERFQADHLAVAADDALGPEAGVHDDALGLGFFDLLQRRRHLVALLQADDVDFARAHAQRGKRDVHHLVRGHRGDRFPSLGTTSSVAPCCFSTSRAAERATSMATLPPPITITFLPMVNL